MVIICKQLEDGIEELVDLRLSALKTLSANWCIDLFHAKQAVVSVSNIRCRTLAK